MYPTGHPIYTHVVMYPVHDEFTASGWGSDGRRVSFNFEDNGRRAAQGRKPHPDVSVTMDLPPGVNQLRAALWRRLEEASKH
jgi:hypothetical protein